MHLRDFFTFSRVLLHNQACEMDLSSCYRDFIIFVTGCTGAGKSDLGVEIAKKFHGEIINADSMQIYKGIFANLGL